MNCCEECKFWTREKLTRPSCKSAIGQCRKYAPKAIISSKIGSLRWPTTYFHEGCGEFEKKESD